MRVPELFQFLNSEHPTQGGKEVLINASVPSRHLPKKYKLQVLSNIKHDSVLNIPQCIHFRETTLASTWRWSSLKKMILHISKKNLQQNYMTKLAFLQFETVL